ncbi:MAG: hypothetical protein CL942_06515 [Desulfovibrio sp.]|nr:hypothetical protein [Desulfovibrio sp.]|tara:strand:+ start:40349 stop:40717 length:369 start_codon:yes stop_codon:yes gene_type:complete
MNDGQLNDRLKDEALLAEIVASLPVAEADDNAPFRLKVMTEALKWAQTAHAQDITLALGPMPKASDSAIVLRELEKREDYRAFQQWWIDNLGEKPIEIERYMDWIEAIRLLIRKVDEQSKEN